MYFIYLIEPVNIRKIPQETKCLIQAIKPFVFKTTRFHCLRDEVCIPIQTVNAFGGTPCVDIKSAHKGFDWDDTKFMLYPEKDVSLTDHDHLAKMRKEAEDMGWTAFEVGNLKRENKQLKKLLSMKKENLTKK